MKNNPGGNFSKNNAENNKNGNQGADKGYSAVSGSTDSEFAAMNHNSGQTSKKDNNKKDNKKSDSKKKK